MAYTPITHKVGIGGITQIDTTQTQPLGTIIQATDPVYGHAEFIYLPGVASTVVGSVVTYDPSTYLTTLSAVGGNIPRPIAIAMSANNLATTWGWYQISGVAVVKKRSATSLAAGAAVGVLSTGLIAATGSGKEICNAAVAKVVAAASGVTTIQVMINRPHKQGRIT